MIYNYLCCEALSYYLSLKMFLKPKGFDICGLVCLRREDYSWIGGGQMLVALEKVFVVVKFG